MKSSLDLSWKFGIFKPTFQMLRLAGTSTAVNTALIYWWSATWEIAITVGGLSFVAVVALCLIMRWDSHKDTLRTQGHSPAIGNTVLDQALCLAGKHDWRFKTEKHLSIVWICIRCSKIYEDAS